MIYGLVNSSNTFVSLFAQTLLHVYYVKSEKVESLWVFGALRGESYMDNAGAFFEYVHHHTPIHACWISKNKELVQRLQAKGYSAYYEYSKEALEVASRAKVACFTHRATQKNADLPLYALSPHTFIVQLWHGIPLKKIAYDDKLFSHRLDETTLSYYFKQLLKRLAFPFLDYINHPHLVPALSKCNAELFAKAFRIAQESIVISGYPRNDKLFATETIQRKVIYMPTFRGEIGSEFNLFEQYGFDVKKVNVFLMKHNILLHVKTHPFNAPSKKLSAMIEGASHIELLEVDDIYDTLGTYAMLITDYSSVYFDYLLLDRPIIFAPFDKESYLKEQRAFYFEYNAVTPGIKANDWHEVMAAIEANLEDGLLYAKERATLKALHHSYCDGKSSKRLYDEVLKRVGYSEVS